MFGEDKYGTFPLPSCIATNYCIHYIMCVIVIIITYDDDDDYILLIIFILLFYYLLFPVLLLSLLPLPLQLLLLSTVS